MRKGWLPWSPELRSEADLLRRALDGTPDGAFEGAVVKAALGRFRSFLTGVEAYHAHPYRRPAETSPVVWRAGSARLIDHGADPAAGSVALIVPSMVNRSYVLDLLPGRSLVGALAAKGIQPLLLDWGSPEGEERGFDSTTYVRERLEPAFDMARRIADGRPLTLVGYCMGGLFALALALRRPRHVDGLALLAVPWDFHAERKEAARAAATLGEAWLPMFEEAGTVPVDVLQTLFAGLDPMLAYRKFRRFATVEQGSAAARRFVALEDWLNDGVPLALPLARDCLIGWYGGNTPARLGWRIDGRVVDPGLCRVSTLAVLPAADRIVPPATAAALADAIPGCERRTVAAGHIGMVAGGRAARSLFAPLADWVRARGTANSRR